MWKHFTHYSGPKQCAEHFGSGCTPGLDTPSEAPRAEERQEADPSEKGFASQARQLPSESKNVEGEQCRTWHWDARWHHCFSSNCMVLWETTGSEARFWGCQGSQDQAAHQQGKLKYLTLSSSNAQKQAMGWFYGILWFTVGTVCVFIRVCSL